MHFHKSCCYYFVFCLEIFSESAVLFRKKQIKGVMYMIHVWSAEAMYTFVQTIFLQGWFCGLLIIDHKEVYKYERERERERETVNDRGEKFRPSMYHWS